MKPFTSPLRVQAVFTEIGPDICTVKVDLSLRMNPVDRDYVTGRVLQFLDGESVFTRLYDGSYLYSRSLTSVQASDSTYDFDACVELDDGKLYEVKFVYSQCSDRRRDFTYGSSRILLMSGTVEIQVDDDAVETSTEV